VIDNTIKFNRMNTSDKYDAIIEFCQTHNKLPYYRSDNKNEKQMRSFLVNRWNIQKRFKLKKADFGVSEEELQKLEEIEKYKESTLDKLNIVLAYCTKYKSTPPYNTKIDEEEIANKKMVSLKNLERVGKLNKNEQEIMDKINSYNKESRLDKLNKLLTFCKVNKRTPKQHVENETEKRLGEFLSTVKRVTEENLSKKEKLIIDKILKFAPRPRNHRREELFKKMAEYVSKHHKAPKNSRFRSLEEQYIGKFYIKIRWLNEKNKLNTTEKELFKEIQKLIFI